MMEIPCNTHFVKILPKYFVEVVDERKNFELRKNDRGYARNDILVLREWFDGKYTGRYVLRRITYVFEGDGSYGLQEGYCILGMRKCGNVIKNIEEKFKEIDNEKQ